MHLKLNKNLIKLNIENKLIHFNILFSTLRLTFQIPSGAYSYNNLINKIKLKLSYHLYINNDLYYKLLLNIQLQIVQQLNLLIFQTMLIRTFILSPIQYSFTQGLRFA